MRMASHCLTETRLTSPKEVVGWMGAMQAQDYAMAKRAVHIRLTDAAEQAVEATFNAGDILRTHVMRPTWHFVSPDDIRWLLALTAPRVKAQTRARDLYLGLPEKIMEQSNDVLRQALQGGKHLLREELAQCMDAAGIRTDNYRIAHLLMRAELDAVICSGALRGKKQTYALLSERAPQALPLDRETSLGMLAQRYFTSHGPATVQDFVWWSGLTATDARRSVEILAGKLATADVNGQTYFFHPSIRQAKSSRKATHFLPAFDEYIIAYRDRSAVIAAAHHSKAISSNGIFHPTVVENGTVTGTWKQVKRKATVETVTTLFEN
jgi:hypothetical protein